MMHDKGPFAPKEGQEQKTTHVFIVGSKGIPAGYGGFETFVQELVRRRRSEQICYHVACSIDEPGIPDSQALFYYEGVQCFTVPMWSIGAGRAIVYDLEALKFCAFYIRKENIQGAVIYVLACRIGPFIAHYRRIFEKLGARLYINPDGHEWERAKWNKYVKKYWRYSERKMVEQAHLVICDSIRIRKYIDETYAYASPRTCFIPYGADIHEETTDESAWERAGKWLAQFHTVPGEYYLIVGRFVPENNYETMIREFMSSSSKKTLLIITNIEKNRFYDDLKRKTGFESDSRIVFAGTLYDAELLLMVRRGAFAYLHGHSVGGTNPSLLEALGSTDVNLLYDVSFNREVGADAALYWSRDPGSLSGLIEETERMDQTRRKETGEKARAVIGQRYTWDKVVSSYESLFLSGSPESPETVRTDP